MSLNAQLIYNACRKWDLGHYRKPDFMGYANRPSWKIGDVTLCARGFTGEYSGEPLYRFAISVNGNLYTVERTINGGYCFEPNPSADDYAEMRLCL